MLFITIYKGEDTSNPVLYVHEVLFIFIRVSIPMMEERLLEHAVVVEGTIYSETILRYDAVWT